ncbi:hypothetical protein [Stackebrandtia soli]|uniref:hypothetical protein n=1 Tax=Stackebrandtia soli TaxID=1892856 RepID=UPI0039E8689E
MNAWTEPLRELAALTGMRANAGEPVEWETVASEFGFVPPDDYRALIDRHGSGAFGCYFDVHGPDDHLYPLERDLWNEYFKDEWEAEPEHAPKRAGARNATVVRWGGTEDAHVLVWLVEPGRPSREWLIGLQGHDGPECEYFEMSTVEFLLAFVKGELRSKLLHPFDSVEDAAYLQWSAIRSRQV